MVFRHVSLCFLGENNFGIASFTINPIYDTPSVLKEYAQKYEMTHPNWNLLTGEQEEIYKLANEGFNLYVGEFLRVMFYVQGNFPSKYQLNQFSRF